MRGYFHHGGEVRRLLACERCPTKRVDRWDRRGDRIGTSYEWPEGYRVPSDTPVTFHDVRVETLHRVKVFDNEAQMLAGFMGNGNGRRR